MGHRKSLSDQLAVSWGPPLPLANSPPVLRDLFSKTAAKRAEHTAVVSRYQPDGLYPRINHSDPRNSRPLRWTYEQLYHGASLLAAALHGRGLRKGVPLAVFLPNGAEWAIAFWAAVRLGAPFVPLDMASVHKSADVQHFFNTIRPGAVIVPDAKTAQTVQENAGNLMSGIPVKLFAGQPAVNSHTHGWDAMGTILSAEPKRLDSVLRTLDSAANLVDPSKDPVLICFTSGTTGYAKACPYTSANIWSATSSSIAVRGITPSSSLVQHLPPSHTFVTMNLTAFWRLGATVVFPSASFDANATLDCLQSERCSHMSAIPPVLVSLLRHPTFSPEKTSCLHNVALGGDIVPGDMVDIVLKKKKLRAKWVSPGFGMSEAMNMLSFSQDEDLIINDKGLLSSGRALMGTTVKICEHGTGRILRRGEVGELHCGGPQVTNGYLGGGNDHFYKDENGKQWIATGDEACMDDSGAVFVTGRCKESIVRGGKNISPALIEISINKVPGIKAHVVGTPDEVAGERPVAVVQYDGKGDIPRDAILKASSSPMRDFKCSLEVVSLQELGRREFPMTTSGKVKKGDLKALLIEHFKTLRITERTNFISLNDHMKQPKSPKRHASQEFILLGHWARLIGCPVDLIPLDTPLMDMSDSITIMKLRFEIQRETTKRVPLSELSVNTTFRDLMLIVNQMPSPIQSPSSSKSYDEWSPQVADMVHCYDEQDRYQQTLNAFRPLLSRCGFEWEADVEACYPMPDFPRKLLISSRPNSPTIKAAWEIPNCSPTQVEQAVQEMVRKWSNLRTIVAPFDNELFLYAVIRASNRLFDQCITNYLTVDHPEDLMTIKLSDPRDSYIARAQSLLFRAHIVRIASTNSIGLIVIFQHSIMDSLAVSNWSHDLSQLLQKKSLTARTPHQVFAELFYNYRTSAPARASINYHIRRLEGISNDKASLWPPSRTPQWFLGPDAEYTLPNGTPGPPRKHLDGRNGQQRGLAGIKADIPMGSLPSLRATHGIAPVVVLKAALALFNMRQTRTQTALFGKLHSGRAWPFLSHSAITLPDAVSIAGPCHATVVNRVSLDQGESILDFLLRLEKEQAEHTRHVHAPHQLIRQGLRVEDAHMCVDIRNHQMFNWFGGWQQAEGAGFEGGPGSPLRLVGHEWLADCGLVWKCGLLNAQKVRVWLQWDGAQVFSAEARRWMDEFVEVAKSLVEAPLEMRVMALLG